MLLTGVATSLNKPCFRSNLSISHMKNSVARPVVPPKRKGIARVWFAFGHSWSGMRIALTEPAFRMEAALSAILLPAAFWLGQSALERAILFGAVVLVLVVEILNTAIEAAIDRVGSEYHDLSKAAKDLGSAAVLLGIGMCCAIWLTILLPRVF